MMMAAVSSLALAALLAVSPQTPPIFQPGAPGSASRVVTQAEAVALSRAGHTAEDVAFMQHMLVHHGQAVEMVALVQDRTANDTIRMLGRRISLSQEAEMELMHDWLAVRGEPAAMPGHDSHAGHTGHDMGDTAVMPGMLTPNQMQALAAARGSEFDRLFLEGMIQHHQGALDMVEDLLAHPDAAEDTLLSEFTGSVVADQSAEILRMQSILSPS